MARWQSSARRRTHVGPRPEATRGRDGSTSRHDGVPQPSDSVQEAAEQLARHGDLGHLEDEVAAVRDYLCANLDHLLPQRGQRPLRNLARQGQGAKEVGEVVRQRMELEPDGVGPEGRA